MQRSMAVSAGLVVAVGLLAACSKPASNTASSAANGAGDVATNTANAAGNAAGGVTQPGGAVSPPSSPENGAVNTDANKSQPSQTPGSNSFTEGQARGHIEHAGYTDVGALTKTPEGLWTGAAKKDGKPVTVSVDFKGAVSAQ